MSNEKKTRVTVEIRNRSYTIVGEETKEHVIEVAEKVDETLEAIHQANKHLDTTQLSVLTAINTMNQYMKLKEEYDALLALLEEDK